MIIQISLKQRILVVIVLCVFLLASFFMGYFFSQQDFWSHFFNGSTLIEVNKELANDKARLIEEKAQLALELDINQKSAILLKQHFERYSRSISKLKNELRFYKGIIDTANDDLGVSFQNIWIKSANTRFKKLLKDKKQDAQLYDMVKFSITIVNKMSSKKYHRGRIKIELFDEQDKKLSAWELLDEKAKPLTKLKVRFRYFQKKEGFLLISKKISVSKIKVSFFDARKGDLGIGQQLDWTLDKDLNYVGQ